jgi:hypothetical protein
MFVSVVSKEQIIASQVEQMDDDGRKVYNKKTLKDQNGQYPEWLSSRKKKKFIKKNRLIKQKQKKDSKKKSKKN